jgi:nucleoid-associated protein EbfC
MDFNFKEMFDGAKKMQEALGELKQKLHSLRVTGESGGGMVSIQMTGAREVVKIDIAPELIDKDNPKMLEDLLVAAFNNASKNAKDLSDKEMQNISGHLPNIPGMDLNL